MRVRYKLAEPFVADRWYKVTARWDRDGPVTMSLQLDDHDPATTDRPMGPTQCVAWHQLLIGNDRSTAPEGLYVDDVEVWDSFNTGEQESADEPGATAG